MAEVTGRNGLNALLNLTEASQYIDCLPADDLELGFDIAVIANINQTMEMIYGPRGARGLALRGGRVMYGRLLRAFDLSTGFNRIAFRMLPVHSRIRIGMPAFARVMMQHSDQTHSVADKGTFYDYVVERCAACWGQQVRSPVCHLVVGLLQEALSSFGRGQEFQIVQTECRAMGAPACVFRIEKEPIA